MPGNFLIHPLYSLGERLNLLEGAGIVAGERSAAGFRLTAHLAALTAADGLSAVTLFA